MTATTEESPIVPMTLVEAEAEPANSTVNNTNSEMLSDDSPMKQDEHTPIVNLTREEGEEKKSDGETTTASASPSHPEDSLTETNSKALKVLFLSSDTGGGHRASAESLAKQFELLFPGSTYQLLDLATETYLPPYNSIVSQYKHLSAHPKQWKILYGVSNSKVSERGVDVAVKVVSLFCERAVRKKIKSYEPDVVISVHPLQTNVPILSCAKISHETGKHLPMFTVVTDLGSAHSLWFANGVEKMFVGSSQIYDLARTRGKVPSEKLIQLGLPIRHDFAVESDKMGSRMSEAGKAYQRQVRANLQLPATDRKTLLVMGGGEGVGSLSNIVDALYCELLKQGIDSVIMVVCGRNEKLKKGLETRDWDALFQKRNAGVASKNAPTSKKKRGPRFLTGNLFSDPLSGCLDSELAATGCIEAGGVSQRLRRILSSGYLQTESAVFIPTSSTSSNQIEDAGNNRAANNNQKQNPKTLEHKAMSIGAIPQHLSAEEGEGEALASARMPSSSDTLDQLYNEYNSGIEGEATQQAIQYNETLSKLDKMDHNNNEQNVHQDEKEEPETARNGRVDVVGLGFVTNMAEYMVAADVLISKAGPGTISEAAALSLPVMLTSFLPGQEEGNVDYVVDGGFGTFCEDTDPQAIAEELSTWLTDDEKMYEMSENAKKFGAPHAARDIVQKIGDSTLKWKEHNEDIDHHTKIAASKTL